jgi:hypothetical protein
MVTQAALDRKIYVEHDPQIGYRYRPGVSLTLPRPGGGHYQFTTNSRGIRSEREYDFKKPAGITRIVLCGDSMAAGQFVSNAHRMSEQLERRVPGLEVINLALEGSGTDQQLLLYETIAPQYEHDAVVLMPFLSNLQRNMVAAREAIDPVTGEKVLRGKPRFALTDSGLELKNVPVPAGLAADVQTQGAGPRQVVNNLPGMRWLKAVVYSVLPWEPFPEFRDANSPAWRLMEAIVARFKRSAGQRPLVVVPAFYDNYVRYRMSRDYWRRFKDLEKISGVHAVDLLPHMQKLGGEATACFQSPYDMHFSVFGHLFVADVLERELRRLRLLPP